MLFRSKCETPDDPHSPQVYGINRVLWLGVFLYVKEAYNRETIERYGYGTPDDWMERNVYTRHTVLGLVIMGLINISLFGIIPGLTILVVQMEPGPMPTLIASAPASISARAPSGVATLPAITCTSFDCFLMAATASTTPDRKSTRLNSSHMSESRMPSSA